MPKADIVSGDGLGRGREMRARERALHAGAKRRVHVEVVVRVCGEHRFMHLREHGGHARRRRRVRGQEAHALAEVLSVRASFSQTAASRFVS
jgi:hypothetical protein